MIKLSVLQGCSATDVFQRLAQPWSGQLTEVLPPCMGIP